MTHGGKPQFQISNCRDMACHVRFCGFVNLFSNPYPHWRGYSPYLLAQQGERIEGQKASGITTTHQTSLNAILSPCLERSAKIGGRGATATEGIRTN